MMALHSCGYGHEGCVTPRHLRWGTQKENMADALLHGTRNRGERQGLSKLNADQVREIRRLRPTKKLAQLAEMFGVTIGAIHLIASRKNWYWLD